jgi:hypothetical protein
LFSEKYDFDFMDYVVRVLRKCKEHGFKVFMDPHQDVVRILHLEVPSDAHITLVVTLFWRIRSPILDPRRLWYQPCRYNANTVSYHPLRMAKCRGS